jgi:hypothetical protein
MCGFGLCFYRSDFLERVTGIEPAQPAWKAGTLAVELHPRWWPQDVTRPRLSDRAPVTTGDR